MNLTQLSFILEKVYNKLGNNFLTRNYITEPFEFKVNVRYRPDDEISDYIIEVSSDRPMPESFEYKPEIKKEKNLDGSHISVIKNEFKKMYEYVEPVDSRKRYVRVNFKT